MNVLKTAAVAALAVLLAGCRRADTSAPAVSMAEAEAMFTQQIELHLTMAQLLDKVGDRKSYERALPVIDGMKKASDNLNEIMAKVTKEQATVLHERYGKEYQAARERVEKAVDDSRRRITAQPPELPMPKK